VQELKELSRTKEEDVKLEANDEDIHRWKARLTVRARSPPVLLTDTFLTCLISASIELLSSLQGPAQTAYEGGVFELNIRVPDQYPLVPPIVYYCTKIFHPNVHFKVCMQGCGYLRLLCQVQCAGHERLAASAQVSALLLRMVHMLCRQGRSAWTS
jgi:ubiquitin-protein ligase